MAHNCGNQRVPIADAAQGGGEYNAVIIAVLMALIDAGPGDLSVDALLGRREWGPGWALGGLAVGAAASAAAIALGRRGGGAARAPQGAVAAATTDQRAGDEFGLLKDQFGIHWMLNISRSTTS